MATSVCDLPRRRSNGFQKLTDGFFVHSGLPFSEVFTPELIENLFRKRSSLFGLATIDRTATVLWTFLGRVLHVGKMAACQSAVAGIIAHRYIEVQIGKLVANFFDSEAPSSLPTKSHVAKHER